MVKILMSYFLNAIFWCKMVG